MRSLPVVGESDEPDDKSGAAVNGQMHKEAFFFPPPFSFFLFSNATKRVSIFFRKPIFRKKKKDTGR